MIYYWAWWIAEGKLWIRGSYTSMTELNSEVMRIGVTHYDVYESPHRDPVRVKAELRDVIAKQRGNLDMVTARFHSKIPN